MRLTVRLLLIVLKARGGSMTAGDVAERFACSWPTTSRHVKVLEGAGLVRVERRGRHRIYRLVHSRLQVLARWIRWFEPGPRAEPEEPASPVGAPESRRNSHPPFHQPRPAAYRVIRRRIQRAAKGRAPLAHLR
jgi:DNA-binding transcriptional ArsR family regulator